MRKRVNIGMELAAYPSIIFLVLKSVISDLELVFEDEPTSGEHITKIILSSNCGHKSSKYPETMIDAVSLFNIENVSRVIKQPYE